MVDNKCHPLQRRKTLDFLSRSILDHSNGLPQPRHRRKRSRSVLQNKLHFISSSLLSSSLMETIPLFLILLLSLSISVSSDPSPKPIMAFPSESTREGGTTYSLFPDEDLRTGKKIRFDDEPSLDRGRRPLPPTLQANPYADRDRDYIRDRGDRYRSYPIVFDDRFHRPGDYSGGGSSGVNVRFDRDRGRLDPFRPRGSRVYFDDGIRDRDTDRGQFYPVDDRFPQPPPKTYYDRFSETQRPSLLDRPSRPYHHHYYPDPPVPGPSHSKLPVGATLGNIGESGGNVRIHVFNPESNSFGNPRNSGKGTNSFVENNGPSPQLFLNHEEYLEYHRKIAFAREQEFKRLEALGITTPSVKTSTSTITTDNPNKRLLFMAKQPFDISRLSPPALDATTPNPGGGGGGDGGTLTQSVEKVRNNDNFNSNHHYSDGGGGQVVPIAVYTGESGGGEGEVTLEVEMHEKPNNHHRQGGGVQNNDANHNDDIQIVTSTTKDATTTTTKNVEVESENSKSQVTQIPPQQRPSFISKSGRRLAYEQIQRQILNQHGNKTGGEDHDINIKGYPSVNVNHFNSVREPLTEVSSFDEVRDKVTTTTTKTTSRAPITSTTTTSTEANRAETIATPLSLIEIPNEKDGFTQDDGFIQATIPQYGPIPDSKKPNKLHLKHPHQTSSMSTSKGKAELRTEVTKSKSRIKTNSWDKISIIRQQELKQKRKKESKIFKKSTLHEHANSIPKSATSITTTTTFNNTTQTSPPLNLRNFFDNTPSRNNFQIPLLPLKPKGIRMRDIKLKDLRLKSNHDIKNVIKPAAAYKGHPFLDNNDLVDVDVDPGIRMNAQNNGNDYVIKKEEEGHFTLINLNNDQVDILEDVGNPNPTSTTIPPPMHRQADINLYNDRSDDKSDVTSKGYSSNDLVMPTSTNPSSFASNFIKVIRLKGQNRASASSMSNFSANTPGLLNLPTAAKTVSMFMAEKMDYSKKKDNSDSANEIPRPRVLLSSSINSKKLSLLKFKSLGKKRDKFVESGKSSSQIEPTVAELPGGVDKGVVVGNNASETRVKETMKMKMSMTSSASLGVIAKVHAHVSHCPKLKSPAEIICDIHIRDSHGHPNPQLTVGWRRKFYNSTQPDILLVSNMTQVYEETPTMEQDLIFEPSIQALNNGKYNGTSISATLVRDGDEGAKHGESLQDFHDKFNVTLAPGISPMLRSVLLIRSVTAPDCGSYHCEVTDGVYTLSSETLLFLCH